MRDRNCVQTREAASGLVEGLSNHRQDVLDVRATRDLRNDTTKPRVQIDLTRDDVGADMHTVHNDGGAGFVTGGFNGEDRGHASFSLNLRSSNRVEE